MINEVNKEKSNPKHTTYPGLRYAKDGVSVTVAFDTRREKKVGLYPVKIQVVHGRTQRYYSTGKDLSVKDWNDLPETKSKKLIPIRNDIKNTFEKVENAVN